MEINQCSSIDNVDKGLLEIIGTIFTDSPEIIQAVLQHMTCSELCRVRGLSKLWRKIADKLLSQRCSIHYTICHGPGAVRHDGSIVPKVNVCPRLLFKRSFVQCLNSVPDLLLVFATIADEETVHVLEQADILHKEIEIMKHSLPRNCIVAAVGNLSCIGTLEHGCNMYSTPEIQTSNCCEDDCIKCQNYQSTSTRERETKRSRIQRSENSLPVGAGCSLSQRAFPDYSIIETYNFHHEKNFCFSLIAFSNKIPGVHFSVFPYDINEQTQSMENLFAARIGDRKLKALLLFEANENEDYTGACIRAALKRTDGQCAVAGSVNAVTSLSKINDSESSSFVPSICVAVTGEGVRAASVVLDARIKTIDQAVREIERLKTVHDPSFLSVIFMFTCIGRDERWYGTNKKSRRHPDPASIGCAMSEEELNSLNSLPLRANLEVAILRTLFPNTPLLGSFGLGEYGHVYLAGENQRPSHEMQRSLHKLLSRNDAFMYSYSTVLLMLQFKHYKW